MSDALLDEVAAIVQRRFGAQEGTRLGARAWFAREFRDDDDGETFDALAGPFDTEREAELAARRHHARLIVRAVEDASYEPRET